MNIEKGNIIQISPIYGFGWRACETNESIDVPEPFAIRVMKYEETPSGTYVVGEVGSKGHRFGEFAILLALRGQTPDMVFWNVHIYEDVQFAFEKIRGMDPKCVCTGFAETGLY